MKPAHITNFGGLGRAWLRALVPGPRRDDSLIPGGTPQSRWSLLWYLLPGLFLVTWIFAVGDGYFSGYVFANDARQQITPYWWFHGSGNVGDSLVYEYMYRYTTLGHRLLYYVLTFLVTPVVASQAVSLALVAAVVFFCYKLGRRSSHAIGAVLMYLVLRQHGWALFGGLPRSFGPPVALAFLYFLLGRNERGILAALVAGAFFYPSVFIICLGAYGLYLLWRIAAERTAASLVPMLRLACVFVVCLAAMLPNFSKSETIGKVVTLRQASEMPEWNRKTGRFRELPLRKAWVEIRNEPMRSLEPFAWRNSPVIVRVQGSTKVLVAISATLIALALMMTGRFRGVVPQVLCYAASSVILYFIARALAFRLFLPDRLLLYGLRIAVVLALCLGLGGIPRLKIAGRMLPAGGAALAGFLALVFILWHPGIAMPGTYRNFGFEDKRVRKEFYGAVKALPRGVIAGDPNELDNVVITTGQDAYFTFETAHPLYDNYYREISRRIRAFHEAYFATGIEAVAAFARDEKVDYLLVNRSHFAPGGVGRYRLFAPHEHEVRERYASEDPAQFALARTNMPGIVADCETFFLLDTRALSPGPQQ